MPMRTAMTRLLPPGCCGAQTVSSADDPRFTFMVGLWAVVGGYLLFHHREAVGESTNYAIRGVPVTARTPACLVGFFGVVLMLLGAFTVVMSVWLLLAE